MLDYPALLVVGVYPSSLTALRKASDLTTLQANRSSAERSLSISRGACFVYFSNERLIFSRKYWPDLATLKSLSK